MTGQPSVTCRTWHACPPPAVRGPESCPSASVHHASARQPFGYGLRPLCSFYSIFPWSLCLILSVCRPERPTRSRTPAARSGGSNALYRNPGAGSVTWNLIFSWIGDISLRPTSGSNTCGHSKKTLNSDIFCKSAHTLRISGLAGLSGSPPSRKRLSPYSRSTDRE